MDLLSSVSALLQIVVIDVSLAGDNAITVGLAASGLPLNQRHRAMAIGITLATLVRIGFAIIAVQLLHITGLIVAGGLLLLWVTWKMAQDLGRQMRRRAGDGKSQDPVTRATPKNISTAIFQIVIADVTMSLDNVLAVAGVARNNLIILAIGLLLSILLMALASSLVARWVHRWPLIGLAGLAIVFYTAIQMIWAGSQDLIVRGIL